MGDYLYSIDNVKERNDAGFNRIDKDRWLSVRNNPNYMADVLKKYRRQLSSRFGEAFEVVTEFALIHDTRLEIVTDSDYVAFRLIGRTEHFNEFKATQREFGMHYKPELGCCIVYRDEIPSFDLESFRSKMSDLEIEVVGELPVVAPAPATSPASREMSPEYALESPRPETRT
jgi:hypothetical protein